MLESIGLVDIAVRQFDHHCGYCTVFCEDLVIQSISTSELIGVQCSCAGKCPSCGKVWEFDNGTFLLTQIPDSDNYWVTHE